MSFTFPKIYHYPIFSLGFEEKNKLSVSVNLDSQNIISDTIYKSKYYNLQTQYAQYCTNNKCNIILTLSKDDAENDFIITFWYRQLSTIQPTYLPTNTLIKGIGINIGSIYYYTNIGKNEEGEILLDFKKGGTKIYAKILKKSEEEDGKWLDRVLLPFSDSIYYHMMKLIQK